MDFRVALILAVTLNLCIQNGALATCQKLVNSYPFYHTSDQLRAELMSLEERCPALTVTTESINGQYGSKGFIDIATINANGNSTSRFFLLAGEHARELISPESALHFVHSLCGGIPELADLAKQTLKQASFRVILNGNPLSRKKVEEGNYCLRVNENGVDLNRNWGDHWGSMALNGTDTFPGTRAFSEHEVRIFRDAVTVFKPDVFLSVHSGTLGMYMPYAFEPVRAPRNSKNMREVLKRIDAQYCKCPYGSAAKEVGYSSDGTCMDYVYDKLRTPFVYAFEIFAPKSSREAITNSWRKLSSDETALRTNPRFRATYEMATRASDFALKLPTALTNPKIIASSVWEPNPTECLETFNPLDEDDYKNTLLKWSTIYLSLARDIRIKPPQAKYLQSPF